MTMAEKIEYIWNKSYTDALGAGHADPFTYADERAAPLVAKLRAAERRQQHPNGLPQRGSRAGRYQAALRRAS